MVFISTDFKKMHVVSTSYLQTGLFDRLIYLFRYDDSTIFGGTNHMVQDTVYIVALMEIEAHGLQDTIRTQQAAEY